MDSNSKVRLFSDFTDAYLKWEGDIAKRALECMRIQYPLWLEPVEPDDLCAGRGEFDDELGFTPQALVNKFCYYFDEEKAERLLADASLSDECRCRFAEIAAFWKTEDSACKLRKSYSSAVSSLLPSDDWKGEAGCAFPLYRMSGTQLDYDKLLRLGIPGLKQELSRFADERPECRKYYEDAAAELDYVTEVMRWYAGSLRGSENENLNIIAGILDALCCRAPETMREAIQLSYLYCQLAGSLNFGRMDEYLGDFLAMDIEAGRLDRESAIDMIGRYWKLIEKRGRVYDSRLTIGGKGRRNEKNADRFALYAIEATRQVRCVAPQVTLRFYSGQNPELADVATAAIAEGCTFPMLYNDDVNIPSVASAFGVSNEEAVSYIPFGCGEYTLYHRSVGTPSGVINLMQILLEVLKRRSYDSYEDLWQVYVSEIGKYMEVLAEQEMCEYRFAGAAAPFHLIGILYDDCLERAAAVFDGGVRHLGGTVESYGGTNAADSLVVIKNFLFDSSIMTQSEMVTILEADFAGNEVFRQKCLSMPKYGNDDDIADDIKTAVDRAVCEAAIDSGKKVGLDSYLVVFINNDANTVLGHYTGASPDGRHSGFPLANGNAPSGGCDRKGLTALLNSMLKPSTRIHAGAVQNLKLSGRMFSDGCLRKTRALLDTYFASGGAQLMITVVNRGDLEDAMLHPENYGNLIVRVGGFSARFIELGRDVQEEILSRTLY